MRNPWTWKNWIKEKSANSDSEKEEYLIEAICCPYGYRLNVNHIAAEYGDLACGMGAKISSMTRGQKKLKTKQERDDLFKRLAKGTPFEPIPREPISRQEGNLLN